MSTGEKSVLRKSIKARLCNLSQDELSEQSRNAQDLILNLPQYKKATRVSVYLSMPKSEAQTQLIVRDALGVGREVFVPHIHRPKPDAGQGKKRSVIEMLRIESHEEYDGLERDAWGIPSLSTESVDCRENAKGGTGLDGIAESEAGLDLIVVPGVAFDAGMNRLGHGAGFYDEFLTSYCADGKRKKPFLVGLCLADQFLPGKEDIPISERDWRMDAIAVGDSRLATLQH